MQQKNIVPYILYLAMFASVGIYLLIAFILGSDPKFTGQPGDPELAQNLAYIFLGLSGLMTLMTFVVPGAMLRNLTSKQGGDNQAAWTTRKIITWALCESVAVYGLIVFFISKDIQDIYIFVGWAVVLFVLHAPRNMPEA